MKRVVLAFACLGLPAVLGSPSCSQSGDNPTGAGGSTAGVSGSAGSSGNGGGNTTGSAGSGGAGNTTGVGGNPAGGGGSTGVAGSGPAGSAGVTGVAGSAAGRGGNTGTAGGAAGVTGTAGTGNTTTRVFPSQACVDKAASLLAMMTVDEKIAQTHQVERKYATAAEVTQYGVGSVYSEGGSAPSNNSPAGWADMIDDYRKASFAHRLKIPMIYGLDSVHGAGPVRGATVLPHNIGLGATRDPALVEEVAQVAGDETAGVGADFPFAPVLAVARDERWGRTYEAFGETSELAATMGTAYTNGLQRRTGRILALGNAKHFVGDGGTANGVNNANTSGNEATLRTIHVDPYKPALAAGLASVMASYSSWQGTRMHANKTMLTDVLKGELGFKGFVGSDYNGCFQDGVNGGSCLDAGVDMFMTSSFWAEMPAPMVTPSYFLGRMKPLITAGARTARLDDAVKRILTVKCEMGVFDGTGMKLVDRALTAQVGSAAHRMVARRAVRASMVLLKNTNTALPIAKTATVALTGMTADHAGNQCGGWTINWQGITDATLGGVTNIKAGMEMVSGAAARVLYSADGANRTGATVGVVVTGETPYSEGCGDIPTPVGGTACLSRPTTLDLPSADVSKLMAYKSAGLKTVLVLVVGRPMILSDAVQQAADAIIVAWLPGSEGAGVADVLYGDYNPKGKLPHTWPRTQSQIPINMGDATYDPLFPYGHGLSYP
jgi:beta-glucosidase